MTIPNKVEWANNIVVDPTTGQNNRTALTASENDNGFIPAFVRPSRQKTNQVLHELADYTAFIYDELNPYFQELNTFVSLNKSGVFLKPNAVYGDGSSSLYFNGSYDDGSTSDSTSSYMAAMCDIFNDNLNYLDPIAAIHTSSSAIRKDNASSWTEGHTGGLKGYSGTSNDIFVHVFMMTNRDGDIDFASDTDISGENIRGNSTIINAGYTHMKRIITLPYASGSPDFFPDFKYSYDDSILFNRSIITNSSVTTTTVSYTALNLYRTGSVNAFPDNFVQAILQIRNRSTSLDTVEMSENNTNANYINLEPGETIYLRMITDDSTVEYRTSSGLSSTIDVFHLGYKNPAIDNGENS